VGWQQRMRHWQRATCCRCCGGCLVIMIQVGRGLVCCTDAQHKVLLLFCGTVLASSGSTASAAVAQHHMSRHG
jgi:hypothetical protein